MGISVCLIACDLQTSKIRGPRPEISCCATKKKNRIESHILKGVGLQPGGRIINTDTSSEKSRTLRNITHGLGLSMTRSELVDDMTSVCRLRNRWHTLWRVLSRRRAVLTLDMRARNYSSAQNTK